MEFLKALASARGDANWMQSLELAMALKAARWTVDRTGRVRDEDGTMLGNLNDPALLLELEAFFGVPRARA